MLLRHELTSTRAWELRGRAALAAAHQGAGAPAIRVARQAERALRRVTTVGAAGLCGLQRAGLAYLAGDRSGAAAHLERALRELADMQQWRRSAQWALGHLRDDETAVEAAQREIAEEGASVPIRFLAMYLPWLRS
jgi:hypothetical protein